MSEAYLFASAQAATPDLALQDLLHGAGARAAWLAGKWGFPEELQRIAALHHDPPPNGPFDLLKLAHLSCRLADCLGFSVVESAEASEPADILTELPHRALTGFGVDTTDLQESLTERVNALE